MIARLEERCTHPPTAVLAAVVALTAAILALLPGVAEAQEEEQQQGAAAPATAPATAPAAPSAVVAPGDSLWSICQERLGPSAPPRQIALDVRRIHEINRNRIGDDPDLIFPGQRLALPPPAGAPAVGAPAARPSGPAARPDAGALAPKTAPLQRLKQAAEAHSQAIQEELEETAEGAPDQATRPAPERAAEPIALPALPEAGAVPEARSLPSRAVPGGNPDVPDDERRRLLGLGIIALTLVLAGLMAWRLPMRRHAGSAEAWGLYPGYYYHHHGEDRQDRHDPDLLVEPKPRPGPAPTTAPARRYEPAKRHEPGRNGAKRAPRKGLAAAHNPAVRRALRRAPRGAPTPPGGPPRNRPGGARGPSRRAARHAVVRRHPAKRRLAAGLARGRNR